ncbi:MAG: hypothetical protein HYZ63_00305 [Candidatus Andersenbacteria bacterium]|nr:hypothetical protein [Candidatus Andersenbacteria bacterium]
MSQEKIAIESLAMDLKRVSLGLQRDSMKMAQRFKQEALAREEELKTYSLPLYMQKLLEDSKKSLADDEAEDILMYSTLFQNFAQKHYAE